MNLSTAITPGMSVQIIDSAEPPSEWAWFVVTQVESDKVRLRSRHGNNTWAYLSEIFWQSL